MSGKKARIKRQREAAKWEEQRPARQREQEEWARRTEAAQTHEFEHEVPPLLAREFQALPDEMVTSQGIALAVNQYAVLHAVADDRLASFLMCSVLEHAGIEAFPVSATRQSLRSNPGGIMLQALMGVAGNGSVPRRTTAVLMDSPTLGAALVDLCSYDDMLFYDGKQSTTGRPTLIQVGADIAQLEDLGEWDVESHYCRYEVEPFTGKATEEEAELVRELTPKAIARFQYLARGRGLSPPIRWS